MTAKGKKKSVRGGVAAPLGYTAAGIPCGIKESGGKDLALLWSDRPASWSAVLTKNRLPAAPVLYTRQLLKKGAPLQAVVVNSGNANAATGAEGRRAVRSVAAAVAANGGLPGGSVLVASTGIIGVELPVGKITAALPGLMKNLARGGGRAAAEGIMTTDTAPKEAAVEVTVGKGKTFRIGGMAKGAGMIHPDMATMLAFLTTDAALSPAFVRAGLKKAVDASFNRISIDGDTSTNDTVLLMANGAAGVRLAPGTKEAARFEEALGEVCRRLAEKIVLDGEGATKLVTVEVRGARSRKDALKAARAVATSSLVKTAWYGADLNWGRIVAALGYSGADVRAERIALSVNGHPAVRGGRPVASREFARAAAEMRRHRLCFTIDLGLGKGCESLLTCDLSEGYVRENALYTT